MRKFVSWVLPIVIGVVVALGIKTCVVQANVVPSSSMYPTIPGVSPSNFALILDNKMATEFGQQIYRGEVVVFHFPDDPSKLYVKRVIGLPGDTVKVTANQVYINGKPLNESNPNIARSNGIETGTWKVPAGHYFMLGDNRPPSDDSRMWVHKYVSRSAIVGEAQFVLYPLNKMSSISQSLSGSNS
ncbi:signal peptidase I [Alicyclobacillus dauci]|uniref:Signal peptidase I n=1 Tax=Alicyclobacillus dauci TaxID=1475485 RepID=A0ABY6ZAG3_9BACL|nr:signal peptidase I [Alicyclobacillus dauci]WAH39146.1 signal peptidase I [Alicyclobacillus dauci]